jgi:hypothetical protein
MQDPMHKQAQEWLRYAVFNIIYIIRISGNARIKPEKHALEQEGEGAYEPPPTQQKTKKQPLVRYVQGL